MAKACAIHIGVKSGFYLGDLPDLCVYHIAKRMETRSFINALISSKWIYEIVKDKRSSFIKKWDNLPIWFNHQNPLKAEEENNLEEKGVFNWMIAIKGLEYFLFERIELHGLRSDANLLKMCFDVLDNAHIFTKAIIINRGLNSLENRKLTNRDDFLKNVSDESLDKYRSTGGRSFSLDGLSVICKRQALVRILVELFARNIEIHLPTSFSNAYRRSLIRILRVLGNLKSNGRIIFDFQFIYVQSDHVLYLVNPNLKTFSFKFETESVSDKFKYNLLVQKSPPGVLVAIEVYISTGEGLDLHRLHQMACAYASSMENFTNFFHEFVTSKTFKPFNRKGDKPFWWIDYGGRSENLSWIDYWKNEDKSSFREFAMEFANMRDEEMESVGQKYRIYLPPMEKQRRALEEIKNLFF